MFKNILIILSLFAVSLADNSRPTLNSRPTYSTNTFHDPNNPSTLFDLVLNPRGYKNKTEFLRQVQECVAHIQSVVSPKGTVYLWDLLMPEIRVILLRKVNYALHVNQSLSWSSLPQDTQNKLLSFKYDFSSNRELQNISLELNSLLSTVQFNMLVDLIVVKEKLCAVVSSFIDQGVLKMQEAVYSKTSISNGAGNIKNTKTHRRKRSNDYEELTPSFSFRLLEKEVVDEAQEIPDEVKEIGYARKKRSDDYEELTPSFSFHLLEKEVVDEAQEIPDEVKGIGYARKKRSNTDDSLVPSLPLNLEENEDDDEGEPTFEEIMEEEVAADKESNVNARNKRSNEYIKKRSVDHKHKSKEFINLARKHFGNK